MASQDYSRHSVTDKTGQQLEVGRSGLAHRDQDEEQILEPLWLQAALLWGVLHQGIHHMVQLQLVLHTQHKKQYQHQPVNSVESNTRQKALLQNTSK